MIEKGISQDAIIKVQPLFNFTGTFSEKIDQLKQLLASSQVGLKGVEELEFVGNQIQQIGLLSATLNLDVTLARGLNYYTGAIYEIQAPDTVKIGSIGGGGRYDDLTGIFGLKDMSGVGISFGLDRIYLVMEELNLFPEQVKASSKVMFLNLGEQEMSYAMLACMHLRDKGIKSELYPDKAKVAKQFQFADKKAIPYVVIVGSQEMQDNNYTLKDLNSGEQLTLSLEELEQKLK